MAVAHQYYFAVKAKNEFNKWSPEGYSSKIMVNSPSLSLPAAPSNLTATANSSSQITLSWQDNSTNETGFKIWRAKGTGSYNLLSTTVDQNATRYVDTRLQANTTYSYKVKSVILVGKIPSYSAEYSNTATATTSPRR